jgi:hypothetical protein
MVYLEVTQRTRLNCGADLRGWPPSARVRPATKSRSSSARAQRARPELSPRTAAASAARASTASGSESHPRRTNRRGNINFRPSGHPDKDRSAGRRPLPDQADQQGPAGCCRRSPAPARLTFVRYLPGRTDDRAGSSSAAGPFEPLARSLSHRITVRSSVLEGPGWRRPS